MQQRQLRLGDILDDYCPRERRVTNHAVVAMVGEDVKQTRCTTCDAEHEYKHAKVPRQRRKTETPAALYSQVLANGPKRVAHEGAPANGSTTRADEPTRRRRQLMDAGRRGDGRRRSEPSQTTPTSNAAVCGTRKTTTPSTTPRTTTADVDGNRDDEEGPVHRPLIRASLPRQEGQQPPARPIPEFTIRQPGGRPNRFRPRHQRRRRASAAAVSRSRATDRTATGRAARRAGMRSERRPAAARPAGGDAARASRGGTVPAASAPSSVRVVEPDLHAPSAHFDACPISPENTASSSASPTSARFRGRSRRRLPRPARASR